MMTIDPALPLTDDEIRAFALALLRGPEPQCEVNRPFHGEEHCSLVTEYRLRTCQRTGNACQVAIEIVQRVSDAGHLCEHCGKPIADCWSYIAV